MHAVDKLYVYFTGIGVDGNKADSLVSSDLSLIPKPKNRLSFLYRFFPKKQERSSLSDAIFTLRGIPRICPNLEKEEQSRLQFVTACLEHIKSGRDPHLKTLAKLNLLRAAISDVEPTSIHVSHFNYLEQTYVQTKLEKTEFINTSIDQDLVLVKKEKKHRQASVNYALINTLPSDLLDYIFSFLPLKERLKGRTVCQKWAKVPWLEIAKRDEHRFLAACYEPTISFDSALIEHAKHVELLRTAGDSFYYPTLYPGQFYGHTGQNFLCLIDDAYFGIYLEDSEVRISRLKGEEPVFSTQGFYTVEIRPGKSLVKKWDLEKLEVDTSYTVHLENGVSQFALVDEPYFTSYVQATNTLYIQRLNSNKHNRKELQVSGLKMLYPDIAIIQNLETDDQIALLPLVEGSQKVLANTHHCRCVGRHKQFLFLVSKQNNILVYDIQTQERISVINCRDIDVDLVVMDRDILYTFFSKRRGARAYDIRKGTVIREFTSFSSYRYFSVYMNKLFYGGIDAKNRCIALKSLEW